MADIQLTRRTVLAAVVAVGLVAAGAGAGTMALFSDTEQSANNTIQAGTLDLATIGSSAAVSYQVMNAKPTDTGSKNITLHNTGSIDGDVTIALNTSKDYDNTLTNPESDINDNTTTGELNESVYLTVGVDTNTNGELESSEVFANKTLDNLDDSANSTINTVSLNADQKKFLHVDYKVSHSAGNEIQSDGVAFNVSATINQKGA